MPMMIDTLCCLQMKSSSCTLLNCGTGKLGVLDQCANSFHLTTCTLKTDYILSAGENLFNSDNINCSSQSTQLQDGYKTITENHADSFGAVLWGNH